jgi:hypothetical protein
MPITVDEAVRIARAFGLEMSAAQVLQKADSAGHAAYLAQTYTQPPQLTRDDVRQLYKLGKHDEIVQAQRDGRLDDLLGRNKPEPAKSTTPTPEPPTRPQEGLISGIGAPHEAGQLTRADLKSMTPDEINAAREAGLCNDLLGIKE